MDVCSVQGRDAQPPLGRGGGIRATGARWAEAEGGDPCAPPSGPSLLPPSSLSSSVLVLLLLLLLLEGWSGSSSWQAAAQSADAALQSRLPAALPQSGCWAPAGRPLSGFGETGESDVRLLTPGFTASPCQLSLPQSLS